MIIDYDRNPSLTEDEKLQSLIENLMLAFGETMNIASRQQKQMDAMQKKIRELEAVADDAILQSTAS